MTRIRACQNRNELEHGLGRAGDQVTYNVTVRGVTLGCGGGNYCPDDPVTRGQMAAFLVRAFNL